MSNTHVTICGYAGYSSYGQYIAYSEESHRLGKEALKTMDKQVNVSYTLKEKRKLIGIFETYFLAETDRKTAVKCLEKTGGRNGYSLSGLDY